MNHPSHLLLLAAAWAILGFGWALAAEIHSEFEGPRMAQFCFGAAVIHAVAAGIVVILAVAA